MKTELPYFEVIERLRVVACPTCGETHAVPAAMFLAKRDKKLIYCPAGHPWEPLSDDADAASNDAQRRIELGAALADTRLKLDAAQLRLLELAPAQAGPLKVGELRRRSRILAGRAEPVRGIRNEGKKICTFCGGKQSESYLPEHIRRRHRDEVAKKPAEYFDLPAEKILRRFE